MARLGDRRAVWWYALLGAIVIGVGLRELVVSAVPRGGGGEVVVAAGDGSSAPTPESDQAADGDTPSRVDRARRVDPADGRSGVVVHVAGAVRRPGVYRLREGARVDDAVRRAGGLRRDAEATAVNLAAELEDGRQVVVPVRAGSPSSAGVVGGPAAGAGGPTVGAPGPLNLNTATAEQLDGLDGVGPGIAAKILAYRQEHGGFRSVDDLGEVPGIGEKRLEALRAAVTV